MYSVLFTIVIVKEATASLVKTKAKKQNVEKYSLSGRSHNKSHSIFRIILV